MFYDFICSGLAAILYAKLMLAANDSRALNCRIVLER